jgi:hypothetical protein
MLPHPQHPSVLTCFDFLQLGKGSISDSEPFGDYPCGFHRPLKITRIDKCNREPLQHKQEFLQLLSPVLAETWIRAIPRGLHMPDQEQRGEAHPIRRRRANESLANHREYYHRRNVKKS